MRRPSANLRRTPTRNDAVRGYPLPEPGSLEKWNRGAVTDNPAVRIANERWAGRQADVCRGYAEAVLTAPLRKASSSALIWLLSVEHMPCGAPGMTFSVAFLMSLAERRAESSMGTI